MKKRYISVSILILMLTLVLFFNKIIFTNLTYFQRDIILQFKPWKVFINKTFAQIKNYNTDYLDFLPLWNPYNHCGAPLMANLQSQVFYPFSLIFYLIPDFATAYKIFILLHFFLSMLFMFLFLRQKNLSFIPSLTGSILWGLNGFMITRIEFLSVFATVIWLPLIVYLFDLITNKFELAKLIFLSFVISIQFLAGHAQMWIYSAFFLLCYSLFRSFSSKTILPLIVCILSIIISILLSAIQFLPTVEFFFNSTRAGEKITHFGMEYEKTVIGSLKISDLINFFYPFNWQFVFSQMTSETKVLNITHYWLFTFYIGFVGSLLTVLGFIKSAKKKNEKMFYLVIILTLVLYTLGENSKFYDLLYKYIFFTRIFRYPSTAIYIVLFIFCIFSAEGLQWIQKILQKMKNKKNIIFFIFLLCLFELFFYSSKISMLLPKSILDEKGELINFIIYKTHQDSLPYRFAHTPLTQKLATTTIGKTFYEIIKKYRDKMFCNINLEYEIYNFRGQDIELKNYYKFVNFVYNKESLHDAIPFFSISNVKYILSLIYQQTPLLNLVHSGEIKVYDNPFVLPLLYPVKKIIVETDLNKALKLMNQLKFEILNTVILHSKENLNTEIICDRDYKFVIHRLEIKPNKIFAIVKVSSPTFLVIAQNYYPGWYCKINNIKTKIYHCNIFMKGIFLKEGEHQIYLYYSPLSFKIGCITTLASLLFCFLYLAEKISL